MASVHTERSGGVVDTTVSYSAEPEFDHRPEDQTILTEDLLVVLRLQKLTFKH
jgi:hypothetical protein